MISKDFSAAEASTKQLTEKHQNLDRAIADKKASALDGLSEQEAKRHKCAIKTELGIRAKNGDVAAAEYLRMREQLQLHNSKSFLQAIAAE